MKNLAPILYAVLGIAVGLYVYGLLGGEERQIKRRLGTLQELVEKDGPESDLDAANKARKLGLLFARQFEIRLLPFDQVVTDRQRLMQVMLGYRRGSEKVGVGFREVDIELQGGGSATMDLVAVATGWTGNQPSREAYRFHLTWTREDGEWCILEAEMVEVLDSGLLF